MAAWVAALLVGAQLSGGAAVAAPGDFGYVGASYTGAGTDPTGSKPESKLWWNDGSWWGSLWEPLSKDFHIYRLDAATQQWSDTGVPIDGRAGTRSDALWDGSHLYVASHVFSNTASAGAPSYLFRFSYDTTTDTYLLDTGFPVSINNYRTETLVIDKDASGTLWATWVQGTDVYVNHTVGGNDRAWGTPFAMPVSGGTGIGTDDISSVIAFQNKIGVMWSNQVTETVHFAVHANGDPDNAWTSEVAVTGPKMADDHINLKADSTGGVWAVTKTSHTPDSAATDPYILLLHRAAASGSWSSHVVALQQDRWTRPIVLLQEGRRMLHVFGTSGEAGGTIYEKTSSMDTIAFEPGKGTPSIRDASNLSMNNATSTKQNLTDATDIAVLAAHPATSTYWHSYTSVGPADTTPPTAPTSLTATAASWDQVDLRWTASVDDVGVVGYSVYRDGSLVATMGPTTTFSDTNVAGSATHTYEVRARDHVGNLSDPSNPASVTTPAAPTVLRFAPDADARVEEGNPTTNYGSDPELRVDGGTDPDVDSYLRFTVSGVSGTIRSAKLRLYASSGTFDGPAVYASSSLWSESGITWDSRPPRTGSATDDKGAITANTWVEWSVKPLVGGDGSYTFVVATGTTDGMNMHAREGPNRPELVVTFDAGPPDTTPPTAPTSLTATATSWDHVDLSWTAASDNTGIAGYEIYRGGALLVTTNGTETTYADRSVAGNTTYAYEVKARDFAGNVSVASNAATVTTPEAARQLRFVAEADARVEEARATTNFGSGTELKVDGGASPDIESFLRFTVSGVAGKYVSAKLRLYSVSQTVRGPAIYTSPNGWSETQITWSTRPARNGNGTDEKGAIPAGAWVEWDVTPLVTGDGTYSFVLATPSSDGIGFHSREAANRPELVVTYDPADRVPPSAPTSLTATAASGQRVDLSWTAATDNVAVTGYDIYRNGALLTTTGTQTTFADLTVAGNTEYTYEVRARDLAQNVSGPSNAVSVTTPVAPTVVEVVAEADARVEEARATTNFGTSTQLRVDGATDPDVDTYLRFTVSGISGTIQSVKLRARAASATANGPAVFASASSWSETGITWSTRPSRTGSATDDKGSIASGTWVEWDVTPLVTGNGTYTLVLATTTTDGVNFDSRETTNKPKLVITSM